MIKMIKISWEKNPMCDFIRLFVTSLICLSGSSSTGFLRDLDERTLRIGELVKKFVNIGKLDYFISIQKFILIIKRSSFFLSFNIFYFDDAGLCKTQALILKMSPILFKWVTFYYFWCQFFKWIIELFCLLIWWFEKPDLCLAVCSNRFPQWPPVLKYFECF